MAYANILSPFIFNVQISQKKLLRRLKTKLNLNTTKWDKEERKKKDLVINMHVVVVVFFSFSIGVRLFSYYLLFLLLWPKNKFVYQFAVK